jgi:flagellar hook assembly protein FlgD
VPSLRPGLSGLVVLAVAAATLVGLAAPAPAATSTGEIVLPPYESLDLPGINYLNGSDAGLVWKKNDDPLRYLPTGTTTPRLADPVASASQITVSGEHLMYRMGYAHVPAGAWTVQSPVGPAVDVDLRTGVRRELTHDENDETAFYRFRGGSGDSWLELRGGHIVRINVDGTTRDYGRPPDDAISTVDSNSQIASAIDDAGVLLHWTTNSGPNFMAYLDFATGTWTKIYSYDVAPKAWQYLTMTAGVIAWPVGSTLYWLDRATLGVVHTRDLGAPIVDLAMAGGRVAVATQATGWPIVIRLGTLSGAFTTITPPMPVQAKVLPIGGGGLGVVAGQSPVNYGVYRLIPGSTELGPPALLFGANPPTFITAGLGQLGVGDLRGGSDAVVRPITVTTDAQHRVSTLTAGDLQVPDSLFALDGCQHSAGYSVCTKRNGKAGYFQEVRQNGQLVGRFAVSTAGHSAQLIQRGLLVHYSCNAAPAPCTEYSELIDLQSGKRTRLPAVNAISGDTIFFVTATGEIRSRDLGTGAETVLRSAGIPAPNTTFQASDYKLEVQGDWLRWFISRDWVPAGTLGAAESFAINLRTHQRVDLTRIDPSIGWDPAAEFAAGVVAWVDDATAVHVLDLTTGTSTVVGSIGTTRYTEALALTSEWVAWMVADGSVHVRPLRTIQAGVPRWSGTIAAPTFSPATEPYSFVGQTSRPLSAWTMTIRSSTSAKVRTLTGSARTGDVTPVWDGKDAKGHVVPDGVYTWTLTGTGPGGALQTSGATPKTVAGTVTVDSTTPTPRFAAPATAKTTGIALRWKSTEQHVTFTVKVSVGTEDKRGGWHYAKAKSWLKGVPDTTATYLNGATTPVDLTKGHRYRFTTTATDLAGNTATRIRTVAIN